MGQSSGKDAEGFQLLRPQNFFLHTLVLGDIICRSLSANNIYLRIVTGDSIEDEMDILS
ncbi:hypothetical protein BMS3Bbin06_00904 [bacterium BMS3Bbin06]|nr:hypothetical protein BMS3Bbin06_00904 [bacterium BMS3Bbin06]